MPTETYACVMSQPTGEIGKRHCAMTIHSLAMVVVLPLCLTTAASLQARAEDIPDVPSASAESGTPRDDASPNRVLVCDEPANRHLITSVTYSVRPTNVKSAYMYGPASISYTKTVTASVAATFSGEASFEGGLIVASASAKAGVALTYSRAWTDGFSYTASVPAGQRRALQLFQASRAFRVTKQSLTSSCTYVTRYTASGNAPRLAREDEWRLVS